MSDTTTLEPPVVTVPISQAKSEPRTESPTKKTGPEEHKGDRLNEHGLVVVNDVASIDAVPLYYYTERNKWFAPNAEGSFGYYPEGGAQRLLGEYGFSRTFKDANGNTPADRAALWL